MQTDYVLCEVETDCSILFRDALGSSCSSIVEFHEKHVRKTALNAKFSDAESADAIGLFYEITNRCSYMQSNLFHC